MTTAVFVFLDRCESGKTHDFDWATLLLNLLCRDMLEDILFDDSSHFSCSLICLSPQRILEQFQINPDLIGSSH